LRGADLRGAFFAPVETAGGVDLSGADLRGARLQGTDFGGADLSVADLRGEDLSGDHLEEAILQRQSCSARTWTTRSLLVRISPWVCPMFCVRSG